MQYIRLFIIAILLCLATSLTQAANYHYEKREENNHVIHLVTITPKHAVVEIIKANNGTGRETVSAIAKRSNATVAINAGFFDIGDKKDGLPSGTLVIKGHTYNIKNRIQPLVVIDSDQFLITQANPKNYLSKSVSMVSGIPLLISNGEISHNIYQKKTPFYTNGHARTAIGTKADGTIVIVVSEHQYLKDLTSISMGEVRSLMKEKGGVFSKKYRRKNAGDITLNELQKILKEEFTSQGSTGLTILELAQFMKAQGCKSALNLDGGGSSTLWINGKTLNQTIGDTDEGNSLKTERPVSDAIIFKVQ